HMRRVAGGEDVRRAGWVLSRKPAVRMRMLRGVSDPVRTPSYMPRVNLQVLYTRGMAGKLRENMGLSPRGSSSSLGIYEYHAVLGHHSNGQDGCFYTGQNRDAAGDCMLPVSGLPPSPTVAQIRDAINRHDGSFSTNYVRVGLNYRGTRVDSTTLVDDRDWTVELEIEQHFHMDPNVFPLYGRTRVIGSVGLAGRPSGMSEHWWDREHWWTCDARREVKGS